MGAEARRILVLPERVGRVDRALRVSKLTGHRSIPETLSHGEVTVDANALWHTSDALACMGLDADYRGPHPISGGSDAPIEVVPGGRGLSRPGDAEQHRGAPRLRRGAPSAGGLGGPFEAPHV